MALVVLVAGCHSSEGRTFQFEFPARLQMDALPVEIVDQVGILVAAAPGPRGPGDGVVPVPGLPDEVAVFWTGGLCDKGVTITFRAVPDGYTLTERTDRAGNCAEVGVFRSAYLRFATPVPAESVAFISDDG